jgi:hypothetical protein
MTTQGPPGKLSKNHMILAHLQVTGYTKSPKTLGKRVVTQRFVIVQTSSYAFYLHRAILHIVMFSKNLSTQSL